MSSAVLLTLLLVGVGGAAELEKRTVTKSSVYLVNKPSFLAAPASVALVRGETVQVKVPSVRGWFEATYKRTGKPSTGFIHITYVSDRPVAFKVKGGDVKGESLISGHYQLAVGGFSPEVENTYRAKHADVNKGFEKLDPYMPENPMAKPGAFPASPRDPEGLAQFVAEGRLSLESGVAP